MPTYISISFGLNSTTLLLYETLILFGGYSYKQDKIVALSQNPAQLASLLLHHCLK